MIEYLENNNIETRVNALQAGLKIDINSQSERTPQTVQKQGTRVSTFGKFLQKVKYLFKKYAQRKGTRVSTFGFCRK